MERNWPEFKPKNLEKLFRQLPESSKGDNGQITIIGGSKLFHGAPLLGLKTAARMVDMVFFSSPEPSVGKTAELLKSQLSSFIWVPWEEIGLYIEKSDAVLIGPGLMRYRGRTKEVEDEVSQETRKITSDLLKKYKDKKWVIDAGSLQTLDLSFLPSGAILTPNKKEYKKLFGEESVKEVAKKYGCTVVAKGPITFVASPNEEFEIRGGNSGLTKGGTGDVQAGLTVGFLAKNEPFLAASAAAYVIKKAAEDLGDKRGIFYNADDIVEKIPEILHKLLK